MLYHLRTQKMLNWCSSHFLCQFLAQIYGRSWLFTCEDVAVPNVLERFFFLIFSLNTTSTSNFQPYQPLKNATLHNAIHALNQAQYKLCTEFYKHTKSLTNCKKWHWKFCYYIMDYTVLQSYVLHKVLSIYYKCLKNRNCDDEIFSLHYCKLGTYVQNVSTRLFYISGLGVHYGKQVHTKYFQSKHFRNTHAHMPPCMHDMQKRNTIPGHVPHQDDHLPTQQLSIRHTTEHQTMSHYQ